MFWVKEGIQCLEVVSIASPQAPRAPQVALPSPSKLHRDRRGTLLDFHKAVSPCEELGSSLLKLND